MRRLFPHAGADDLAKDCCKVLTPLHASQLRQCSTKCWQAQSVVLSPVWPVLEGLQDFIGTQNLRDPGMTVHAAPIWLVASKKRKTKTKILPPRVWLLATREHVCCLLTCVVLRCLLVKAHILRSTVCEQGLPEVASHQVLTLRRMQSLDSKMSLKVALLQ